MFADSRAVDAALVACRLHPPTLLSDATTGLAPHPQRKVRRRRRRARSGAGVARPRRRAAGARDLGSEEHTSELQSLMRISYAVFCLKKKKKTRNRIQLHQGKHT